MRKSNLSVRRKVSKGFLFQTLIVLSALGAFIFTPLSMVTDTEEGITVRIITVTIGTLIIALFFYELLCSRIKLFYTSFMILSYLVIICLSFVSNKIGLSNKYELLFFARSLPALLGGVLFAQTEYDRSFRSVTLFVMIELSAALVLFVLLTIQHGWSNVQGSALYQAISYTGAYASGLNCYLILTSSELKNGTTGGALMPLFLPIQVLCVFITGGRGGAVACLCIYIFYKIKAKKRKKQNWYRYIWLLMVAIGFVSFINKPEYISSKVGLSRFLSSDRIGVYSIIIPSVTKTPFLGYGALGYMEHLFQDTQFVYWPHNIFLEYWMQWGYLALLFIPLAVLLPVFRILRMHIDEEKSLFVAFIAIVAYSNLLFSATYLTYAPYWFVVGFTLFSPSVGMSHYSNL